jgi:hypothetical protein
MSEKKIPQAPQIDRFIETARALGCDEDKEKFEAALAKIAAHKPHKAEKSKANHVKKTT